MDRVYIGLEADRLTVAAVLVKNKYTVRQGSEKREGSKSYDYFLEYERNTDNGRRTVRKDEG